MTEKDKYFVLLLGIVIMLASNDVQCADGCDPKDFSELSVDTYRSGLERLIQGFEDVVSTVTGGNKDNDDDNTNDNNNGQGVSSHTFSAVLSQFEPKIHAIFPGTLWCGSGDIAPNSSYLGPFDATDACCRSHDECATNIDSGGSYGSLKNTGVFTRSACGCDHAFYQCLKKANSVVSSGIGNTYFNILRPQCFTCDYPIVGCAKKDKY